ADDRGARALIERDLIVTAAVADVGGAAEAERARGESDVRRAGDAARVRLAVAAADVRVALDHTGALRVDVETIGAGCGRGERDVVLRGAALVARAGGGHIGADVPREPGLDLPRVVGVETDGRARRAAGVAAVGAAPAGRRGRAADALRACRRDAEKERERGG